MDRRKDLWMSVFQNTLSSKNVKGAAAIANSAVRRFDKKFPTASPVIKKNTDAKVFTDIDSFNDGNEDLTDNQRAWFENQRAWLAGYRSSGGTKLTREALKGFGLDSMIDGYEPKHRLRIYWQEGSRYAEPEGFNTWYNKTYHYEQKDN
jgi:hypothetical protein